MEDISPCGLICGEYRDAGLAVLGHVMLIRLVVATYVSVQLECNFSHVFTFRVMCVTMLNNLSKPTAHFCKTHFLHVGFRPTIESSCVSLIKYILKHSGLSHVCLCFVG